MTEIPKAHWKVVGQSVRGAAHERTGTPNQDAISWLPQSGAGPALVLAVADGHGSARYSRSHIGANLAVDTTTQLIHDFLLGQADADNLSVTKRAAEEWLPGALVRAWLEAVDTHLKESPLTEAELQALRSSHSDSFAPLEARSAVAYGATVLVAGVTAAFILYLQLGDGEILTVNDQGEVSKPLARDVRLFANETTSLCTPDAWRDVRVGFQTITRAHPALILLATDGYPNSFRDETGFLKVGSDMLEIIRREGLGSVQEKLGSWLSDSTIAGSGDDVTLGILCSVEPEAAAPKTKSARTGRVRSKKR